MTPSGSSQTKFCQVVGVKEWTVVLIVISLVLAQRWK